MVWGEWRCGLGRMEEKESLRIMTDVEFYGFMNRQVHEWMMRYGGSDVEVPYYVIAFAEVLVLKALKEL